MELNVLEEVIHNEERKIEESGDKNTYCRITPSLIVENSLDPDLTSSLKIEEKVELIFDLNTFYLQDLRIRKIENLNLYSNLIRLHLQFNFIEKIEGLEELTKLELLVLNHNQIKEVEGIRDLVNLWHLDLSFNKIERIDEKEIPENIKSLRINDNSFDEEEKLIENLIITKKDLFKINSEELIPEKRLYLQGKIPKDIYLYKQKMNEIKQIKQENNSKIVQNWPESVNNNGFTDEIRTKTLSILESFMQSTQEKKEKHNKAVKDYEQYTKKRIETMKKAMESIKMQEEDDSENEE